MGKPRNCPENRTAPAGTPSAGSGRKHNKTARKKYTLVYRFPLCYNLKKQTQKRTKGRKEMAEEIITSTNA
ncbi:MAG: hypothetical protein ACLSFL_11610, partial [Faecalibacterium sp.]